MRALLINPPTGRYIRSDRCQAPVDTRIAEPARPPMDLAYMAAVLEKTGTECQIKDYPMEGQGWRTLSSDIQTYMPDFLIISVTTPTIENDLMATDLAKTINPKIRTVAKGAHFYLFDEEMLSAFRSLDVALRGEPEVTIKELADGRDYPQILGISFRQDTKIIRNPDRPFLENIDELTFPARHLLNNSLYRTPDTNEPIAFVITSRGCPGKCIFCAAGLVSGYKLRTRSVESVVEEIEECVGKYKFRNFFFSADTFTWHKQWVLELCAEILKRKIKIRWGTNSRVDTLDEERIIWMKKAGCYVIGFGAESGSQTMLNNMKKGITVGQIESAVSLCKKHDIESFLVFVIGLPWETAETVTDTIRFVKHTRASFIEVNVAYPLPGTEFYTLAKKNDLFVEASLGGHNYSDPVIRSFSLSTAELKKLRKKILRSFYARPGYILDRISKISSRAVALNYFKYGFRLLNNLLKT